MFYDSEYLSVLLEKQRVDKQEDDDEQDKSMSLLAQVPLQWLEQKDFLDVTQLGQMCLSDLPEPPAIDVGPRITHYRKLTAMRAKSLAVSGTRKVACVLSLTQRHVRLFDMVAEDDETEDDEVENEDLNNSFEGQ